MSSVMPELSHVWKCPECSSLCDVDEDVCPCCDQANEPKAFELSWEQFWRECEDLKHG